MHRKLSHNIKHKQLLSFDTYPILHQAPATVHRKLGHNIKRKQLLSFETHPILLQD
jgi:hypothetical protein